MFLMGYYYSIQISEKPFDRKKRKERMNMKRVVWLGRCAVAMAVVLFLLSPSTSLSGDDIEGDLEGGRDGERWEGGRRLLALADPTSHCINGTLSSAFRENYGLFDIWNFFFLRLIFFFDSTRFSSMFDASLSLRLL